MKPHKKFESFLQQAGVLYDIRAPQRLSVYLSLLQKWSQKMNLVSAPDVRSLVENHFIPSFWYFFNFEKAKTINSVLDIGSGAGFPGLVINILNPELELFMVESNKKKSLFLKECAEHLELSPKVVNERMADFRKHNKKSFDVITSRAVTSVKQIINWSEGLTKKHGRIYVLKGIDYRSAEKFSRLANIVITELSPDKAWILNAPKLKNKLLLKIEKYE